MPNKENTADKLSYSVFLNEIVEQLWPNINVAGSQMIKEIAEPMFKTMLPGPLKTLHFTKIDLGTVPLKLNGVLLSPLKLTIIQPLAARHEVASRLSKSRDAILAGDFKQAWASMQAVLSSC